MPETPVERVISTLIILSLARRGLTRREIAEKVGRSQKQVGRYLDVLTRLQLPIVEEPGSPAVAYRLDHEALPAWATRLHLGERTVASARRP